MKHQNLSEASCHWRNGWRNHCPGSEWLSMLQEPPCDQIKFLTKVEQDQIEFPLTAGPSAQALLITCLRVALFSQIQNQLVQSQRAGKQADVDQLIYNRSMTIATPRLLNDGDPHVTAAEGLRDTVSFRTMVEQRSDTVFHFHFGSR